MCFSASGSFGAAAIIAATGAVALTQRKVPAQRLLAAVPLLFAVQQCAEGAVWLTMDEPGRGLHRLAVMVFLGTAAAVWPTWMPLALLIAEPRPSPESGSTRPTRRQWLAGLTAVGVVVSIYAVAVMMRSLPVARIAGHSLAYSYAEPSKMVVALHVPMYALATVVPFFVSSLDKAKLMGALLACGMVATFVIKRDAMVSTWCFYAAILSGVIVASLAAESRLAPVRADGL
jgi:hypothetical protein